mmetsp:Transcript_131300/g.379853  ORF Transcript_131300/g.379853 Transcript_131300/m.379853 type:complete len:316 (-) Transcript_131300:171-1118(-)
MVQALPRLTEQDAEELLRAASSSSTKQDLEAKGFVPLTIGFANIVFGVERGGQNYVVKKYTDLILLRIAPEALGACDILAGEVGVGPKVLYSSSGGMVMERIPGVELQEQDMHSCDFDLLDSVAKALSVVHRLEVPQVCEGEPMLWRTISSMMEVVRQRPELMPDGFPGFDEIQEEIREARFALERYQPRLVLAHGDFKPSNVMRHGDEVAIIDFELAGPNYRGFDLMKVFRTAFPSSEKSMRRFLATYASEVGEVVSDESVSDLLKETRMFEPLTWLEAAIFFLALPQFKPGSSERWHHLALDRWSKFQETKHM